MPDENIIYAQVLLLDGKIETWKICQSKKSSPYEFTAFWKHDRVQDYTMETMIFNADEMDVPAPWDFNSYVYGVAAPQWINQWQYADDYHGGKAIVKTYEKYYGEIHEIEKNLAMNPMFSGLKVVGKLGEN